MSRLTRLFGVGRKDEGSGTDPDEGLASDNASRDLSDSRHEQWGDWSQGSDNDMQYLEALNEHEGSIPTRSVVSDPSHRNRKSSSPSGTKSGDSTPSSPKKDKGKHRKGRSISKSEALSTGLDVGSVSSEGISSTGVLDTSSRRKSKKREKRHDETSKSSSREQEKKDHERKRRSKADVYDGLISDYKPPDARRSAQRSIHSQNHHRSRSRSRTASSRPTRSHSADAGILPRPSSSSKSSSRQRREGSKRDSLPTLRPSVDAKDIDKKSRSSRQSRLPSRGSASKYDGTSDRRSSIGMDAALMPLSGPSVDPSAVGSDDQQGQEILRLHQMLSDALQKIATQSAEQIHDKDVLMKVSGDLTKLRLDLELAERERNDLKALLEERDQNIKAFVGQIDSLTGSLESQRASQAVVEADLEQSEADVDKLLIKIEDLERAVDHSGNVTDETLRAELKEVKMSMVDKNREVESSKNKIVELEKEIEERDNHRKELEKELQEIATVNKLQISDLEDEIKSLQGKLKGERLEASSRFSEQEERISALTQELTRFRGNSEFEEIAIVRGELDEAQNQLDAATLQLEASKNTLTKVKAEKEELLERNNKLNTDMKNLEKKVNELNAKSSDLEQRVLKWTEQTYEWKSKAEAAEKKLSALADGNTEVISDSGSAAEEAAPQGLFLQAIMDKKENTKKANRWKFFQSGDEDQTAEEIRIRGLEEQNQGLQEKNTELHSDLVKIKSAHKDEMYNNQKLISQLKAENEALKLKTQSLDDETIRGCDTELNA